MLFFKCPTCKTLLADKQIPFEEGMDKICNDTKLTDEQKDKKRKELLDKLELHRYCCRMRILTYTREELILV